MFVVVNLLPLSPKWEQDLGNRVQYFDCIHENLPYLSWKFCLFLSATGLFICNCAFYLQLASVRPLHLLKMRSCIALFFFICSFYRREYLHYNSTWAQYVHNDLFSRGIRMKEDFHFCFLVITSSVYPLFCLNAIGSIYNYYFIV